MMERTRTEQALRRAMEDAASLLEGVAEKFWSTKLRWAVHEPVNPAEVLSWFGGMGSLNDLFIAAANGHNVRPEDEALINTRLDEVRMRIYELALGLVSAT